MTTTPPQLKKMKEWKLRVLDSKSPSFCGAKWYNASMWLFTGWTTSCHHNPPHEIDIDAIKNNPRALHNTPIKKNERAMMQRGEKPLNCQFCWVMEDTDPDNLADRTWLSTMSSEKELQEAFDSDNDRDFDLQYLEISFDRTCNLACSYCCPAISSSWARDIRNNGPYLDLTTDQRQHYISSSDEFIKYKPNQPNPYAEAFFQWWESSLHKSLRVLRLTGGEPMMSGETWRLFEWMKQNKGKSRCTIHITTNLCYDKQTMDRFLSAADNMGPRIEIFTSGEAFGSKGEYIRDGLDWEQWIRNVDAALESKSIRKVSICGTISAPAVDGFAEFLQWLIEKKKTLPHGQLELSVNPVRFPTFQNIIVLPIELRQRYSREISELLHSEDGVKWFTDFEKDHIGRFVTYLDKVEIPHKEERQGHGDTLFTDVDKQFDIKALQEDCKKFFTQYDQRRNKNFCEIFPNLKDWWESI